jgi:hypothetical protein
MKPKTAVDVEELPSFVISTTELRSEVRIEHKYSELACILTIGADEHWILKHLYARFKVDTNQ